MKFKLATMKGYALNYLLLNYINTYFTVQIVTKIVAT